MGQELILRKAQRSQAYLKLGMSAPSGGGKTASALLMAYGLMKEKYPNLPDAQLWEKIAIIDTENGSGELYVGSLIGNTKVGVYNTLIIVPPFEAQKYMDAMDVCRDAGMEVCIIDSTTHLWSGEGGLLEQQGQIAKRTGNSYTAWQSITPMHTKFLEKIITTPMHIIATVRAKEEHVQEKNDQGKTIVRKVGLEPEQRKGIEFEFTVFLAIDHEHVAFGSKDRTGMFDQKSFVITPDTGKQIMKWLNSADTSDQTVLASFRPADPVEETRTLRQEVVKKLIALGGSKNSELMQIVKAIEPSGNVSKITDESMLKTLMENLIKFEMQTPAQALEESVKNDTKVSETN